MYSLIFFGDDGEFSYVYSTTFSCVENAFRSHRLYGLTWTMDGDTFTSERVYFGEPGKFGTWNVTRTENLAPEYTGRV
jgi:hypothetical protein